MKYRIVDVHSDDAHSDYKDKLIGCIAVPVEDFHESYVEDEWAAGYFEVTPNNFDGEPFFFLAVKLEEVKEWETNF